MTLPFAPADPAGRSISSVDPVELAARVEALPLVIESLEARTGRVAAWGWAGGFRPAGFVLVEGAGEVGVGECVAWTEAEQRRLTAVAARALRPGRRTAGEALGEARSRGDPPHARAALEAGILDLALRQAATNPFRLSGVSPRPVAVVLSFAAAEDPLPVVLDLRERAPNARVKLDVDPTWTPAVLTGLASARCVRVLDLKLGGDLDLAERVHAALPEALIEDPRLAPRPLEDSTFEAVDRRLAAGADPSDVVGSRAAELASASLGARVSFDQPVRRAGDVRALPLRPAAVNVKPARLGGWLEAYRTIAACRESGLAIYVGGMFEVGPGRSQVQALASLFCPEGPNDVAPLAASDDERRLQNPLPIPDGWSGLGFEPIPALA